MLNIEFKDSIEADYYNVGSFHNGLARIMKKSGLYGFINKTGEEVISCEFNMVRDFSEGLAVVENEIVKSGCIDLNGNIVIPFEFDYIKDFSEGYAIARKGLWQGLIDKKGNKVSTFTIPAYKVGSLKNGICMAEYDIGRTDFNKVVYINKEGKIIGRHYEGTDFEKNFAIVKDHNDKPAYKIDTNGNFISSIPGTEDVDALENAGCGVTRMWNNDGNSFYIDENGNIISSEYDISDNFSEDVASIYSYNSNWFFNVDYIGFIDKKSLIHLVDKKYAYLGSFTEGLARCKNDDNQYGYINKEGVEIIPCSYNHAYDFSEGLALVQDNVGQWYFIDQTGKKIITMPATYRSFVFVEGKIYADLEADSEKDLYVKKREFLLSMQKEVAEAFDNVCEEEAKTLKRR